MNFGIQDLRYILKDNFYAAGGKVTMRGGEKKYLDDTALRLYQFLESKCSEADMHPDMKAQARARGIPDAILDFSDRTAKALGFSITQLDDVSREALAWIMEQETQHGQTIEAFADWARKDEQGKFMSKYRKGAGIIRNDWARAFTAQPAVRMLASDEGI